MSDDRDRARLEAIVFGRDAAVSDAEREVAASELARMVEDERAQEAARMSSSVAETLPNPPPPEASNPDEDNLPPDTRRSSWRRRALIAVIAVAAVVIAGIGVRVLVLGLPPFGASDSMAIFDRPQTERDLEYPESPLGLTEIVVDSVRYLGSHDDLELYAFQIDQSQTEVSLEYEVMPCLLVVEGEFGSTARCFAPEEFSAGPQIRLEDSEEWHEIEWDVDQGIRVTSGESPPVAPAPPLPEPLSVFDEEQDDADLNALAYLPDIPPSRQDTVRFIGSSAGYFVAAYRAVNDQVCLAVYEGGTTVATAEYGCISEDEFEEAGIQLIYPAAAPEISVTWGPEPGLAFGGR